jgi:hypothetical protein
MASWSAGWEAAEPCCFWINQRKSFLDCLHRFSQVSQQEERYFWAEIGIEKRKETFAFHSPPLPKRPKPRRGGSGRNLATIGTDRDTSAAALVSAVEAVEAAGEQPIHK